MSKPLVEFVRTSAGCMISLTEYGGDGTTTHAMLIANYPADVWATEVAYERYKVLRRLIGDTADYGDRWEA